MLTQFYEQFGMVVVFSVFILLTLAVIAALLLALSLRRHRFYMPDMTYALLMFFRSFFKSVFRFLRLDDTVIDQLYVDLNLPGLEREFFAVPPDERVVFFPQCLRSVECPARLTPEGIACEGCGRCRLCEAKDIASELGYRFYIVPGSSFIRRAIIRHTPGAALGIGCLSEIKEGVEMLHHQGLPVYAIQLETSGCINTTVDWERVFEVLKRYDGDACSD